MKKLSVFIHPILFAIFPTISLYSHNITEAWPDIVIAPMLLSLAFALASYILFFTFLRKADKASVMTSIWLMLFFSYGHVYLLSTSSGVLSIFHSGPNIVLVSMFLLALIVALLILMRVKRDLSITTNLFNVVAIALIGINLAKIIPLEVTRFFAFSKLNTYVNNEPNIKISNYDRATYPDIYYFIFDRYGRQDVLKKYFDYDNEPTLSTLEREGFYVARRSLANYPSTFLSLSSSLNMRHLEFVPNLLGSSYSDRTVVYSTLIENNQVIKFLKERGYKYVLFGDAWPPTKQSKMADRSFNTFAGFDQFQLYLYENTLLNTVLEKTFSKRVYSGVEHLSRIIKNLEYRIKNIQKEIPEKGPKFVFGHFLLPHPPYLFSDDCSALSFEAVRKRALETGYISQLNCANKVMRSLVREIRSHSPKPAVIILQSDEGPYLPSKYFPNEIPSHDFGYEPYIIHASILNSYYLPDKQNPNIAANYSALGFHDSLTPANTFRLLFNYYFGADLKPIKDANFIFKDTERPYDFFDITDIVN